MFENFVILVFVFSCAVCISIFSFCIRCFFFLKKDVLNKHDMLEFLETKGLRKQLDLENYFFENDLLKAKYEFLQNEIYDQIQAKYEKE